MYEFSYMAMVDIALIEYIIRTSYFNYELKSGMTKVKINY
jgi:hypothetical protein